VLRAKIVLAAADDKTNESIAAECHTSKPTVGRLAKPIRRFADSWESKKTLLVPDARRPSPQRTVTRILQKTTQEKPEAATHWSTRSMAKAIGVGKDTVRRVWAAHGLKPHLTRTFKLSNDPRFEEKLVDVVGLYLDPPEHALVLLRRRKDLDPGVWIGRNADCQCIAAVAAR